VPYQAITTQLKQSSRVSYYPVGRPTTAPNLYPTSLEVLPSVAIIYLLPVPLGLKSADIVIFSEQAI